MRDWQHRLLQQSLFGFRRPRSVTLASLLFFFLTASPVRAQTLLEVHWENNRLSVNAEKTPLAQILKEVSRQTDLEIRGLEELQEETSVHFVDLALNDALKLLLAHVNHLVIMKESSTPKDSQPALVLLFKQQTAPPLSQTSSEDGLTAQSGQEAEEQEKRLTALYTAAANGDAGALEKAFSDPQQDAQAAAFALLAQLDRQKAIDFLAQETKSEQPETRYQALRLLTQASQAEDAVVGPILNEALAGDDQTMKQYAIQALAERMGESAGGYLRQALSDPDPTIRMAVIENVAQTPQSLPLLQEALADPDAAVRSMAVFWLEQLATERRE